jgi:thiamine-monophosphate kinase
VPRAGRPGEFDLIARHFAPLAKSFAGAGGLRSDNAFLPADPRHDLVVKTDTIVAGVHFLADEKPAIVAAKALRVCLSDLAAGGARPYLYQLALALPKGWSEGWVARFAAGLAADQRSYDIVLCGGDTVVTPGPLTITITAFGRVARGLGLGRGGARVGDDAWVSGTIGDGALGLLAARGRLKMLSAASARTLERRYRLPQPRNSLGIRLIGVATAAADISDGLLADAGHIADASEVSVHIERDAVPLSGAAARAVTVDPHLWANVLGGGDDYELVFAVPPRRRVALLAAARAAGIAVTAVGRFEAGEGVRLTAGGRPLRMRHAGFVHR